MIRVILPLNGRPEYASLRRDSEQTTKAALAEGLAVRAERDALAADADKWQRAALTLQGDRDALTDERDSLSWQVEALRAERDARSSERDALATKVDRVRALHFESPFLSGACNECDCWYPCETTRALDEDPQP